MTTWYTVDETGHVLGVAAELPQGRVCLDPSGNIMDWEWLPEPEPVVSSQPVEQTIAPIEQPVQESAPEQPAPQEVEVPQEAPVEPIAPPEVQVPQEEPVQTEVQTPVEPSAQTEVQEQPVQPAIEAQPIEQAPVLESTENSGQ